MTDYNYIFGSLRSEEIIAEIPMFGTYMDLELNAGGRFDGAFNLDQTGKDNQTLLDATVPGRSFICCERNGKPIWIGFIWSRTYQSQAKSVQIFAQSFENYPQYQLVRNDFSRTADSKFSIFNDLWTNMQSVTGRNININVDSLPYDNTTTDISILATDFKMYGEALSELADGANGFDWIIDIAKSGTFYIKTIRMATLLGATDHGLFTLDYPGSILNYYATESMAGAGTNVFIVGAGEGSTMSVAESTQNEMIIQGFPRWDFVVSRKDISTQFAIDSMATQEGAIRRPPQLFFKPTPKGDRIPEFGSFGLGDACSIAIKDSRFPDGKLFNTRIAKWTLQPQSSSNTEEYSLVFVGDDESG
jgi:hypothetical protein